MPYNFIAMRKNILIALCMFACSVVFASDWGFYAHKKINGLAIKNLPEGELKEFFSQHTRYLVKESVAPDKRRDILKGEAQKHYINVDAYPFAANYWDSIPHVWQKAVKRFSEDTLQKYGILPWTIAITYHNLVQAFRQKDVERILFYAADLGHYCGDLHVPLHLSKNHNGQLTGQNGVHALWESVLVEKYYKTYTLAPESPKRVKNALTWAWERIPLGYAQIKPLLLAEQKATDSVGMASKYLAQTDTTHQHKRQRYKKYNPVFLALYHENLQGMIPSQLEKAIAGLSSLWYSAYLEAGKPRLNILKSISEPKEKETTEEHAEELEALDN